jgi:hemin uptake protein HemP
MNAADAEDKEPNKAHDRDLSEGLARHLTITNHQMDSRDLFVGTREVVIVHGRDAYHLRLTAQNKLILTK